MKSPVALIRVGAERTSDVFFKVVLGSVGAERASEAPLGCFFKIALLCAGASLASLRSAPLRMLFQSCSSKLLEIYHWGHSLG